jgi:hypothetical protein
VLTCISASSKLKFCRARQSEYSVSCSYTLLLNLSIRSSTSQIKSSIFSRHPNISLANEDISVVDQVHKGGVDILLQSSNCIHLTLSRFRIHSSTRANSKNFQLQIFFSPHFPTVSSAISLLVCFLFGFGAVQIGQDSQSIALPSTRDLRRLSSLPLCRRRPDGALRRVARPSRPLNCYVD